MNPINSRKAAAAFNAIAEHLGRDEVQEILSNWNDSELNEDATKIFQYIGRDRKYSSGKDGGKITISKTAFVTWLLSAAPFDQNIYGKSISADDDWRAKIESARRASGLQSEISNTRDRRA